MKCEHCGSPVTENQRICGKCGNIVVATMEKEERERKIQEEKEARERKIQEEKEGIEPKKEEKTKEEREEEEKRLFFLGSLSIILIFTPVVLFYAWATIYTSNLLDLFIFSIITCPVAGSALFIYLNVTYPNNPALKFTITLIAIGIISSFILVPKGCSNGLDNWFESIQNCG